MGRKTPFRGIIQAAAICVLWAAIDLSRASESSGLTISTTGLAQNLDLPVNAVGEESSEESVPESVIFYGHSYEATAVVFALDQSASMRGYSRWEIQVEEVTKALSSLSEDADFGIVFYNDRVTSFREVPLRATEANKLAALEFVRSQQPRGQTCLGDGVVKALGIVRQSSNGHQAVLVTSDGRPDYCAGSAPTAQDAMRSVYQQTLNANPARKVAIHTIYVGTKDEDLAIEFMQGLAQLHGGTFRLCSR